MPLLVLRLLTTSIFLENMNLYVWGNNSEGLLGLGYGISSVENPTKLEIHYITFFKRKY